MASSHPPHTKTKGEAYWEAVELAPTLKKATEHLFCRNYTGENNLYIPV